VNVKRLENPGSESCLSRPGARNIYSLSSCEHKLVSVTHTLTHIFSHTRTHKHIQAARTKNVLHFKLKFNIAKKIAFPLKCDHLEKMYYNKYKNNNKEDNNKLWQWKSRKTNQCHLVNEQIRQNSNEI